MRAQTTLTCLLGLCFALLLLAPAPAVAEDIAVIVNPKNKVSDLSTAQLRAMFLRQKSRWSDGERVILLNTTARASLRRAFDRAVLKMSPDEAGAYWIRFTIQGKGQPPWSTRLSKTIQRLVASQRGAISYLRASAVQKGVKVIKVDGLLPGDKDYPIVVKAKE